VLFRSYKDANGNWFDAATGAAISNPLIPPATPSLTDDELKAYADTMFNLVNQEREAAGIGNVLD
jgi:hypothetical protein